MLVLAAFSSGRLRAADVHELPEFPYTQATDWLNTKPLTVGSLRGRPVLIEFWAFECSNCLATEPWVRAIASRYREQGLVVIGVHTPELPHEHDPQAVSTAVRRLGITYPIMLDTDYRYWRALGNHYWPAFYLFDGQGHRFATTIGELHAGEERGDGFEELVRQCLHTTARDSSLVGKPAR